MGRVTQEVPSNCGNAVRIPQIPLRPRSETAET
jgi:hypothetical protein